MRSRRSIHGDKSVQNGGKKTTKKTPHTYTLKTQANIINYDFFLFFSPILPSVYFLCIISARLITAPPVRERRLHNKDEALPFMNVRRESKINESSHSAEVAAGNYFAWRRLCDVSGGHNVFGGAIMESSGCRRP